MRRRDAWRRYIRGQHLTVRDVVRAVRERVDVFLVVTFILVFGSTVMTDAAAVAIIVVMASRQFVLAVMIKVIVSP